ncbi:MAG TPA: polysaccharide lyase [Puia sp.]|nr:polysaccharide lyase [Puia sp.]
MLKPTILFTALLLVTAAGWSQSNILFQSNFESATAIKSLPGIDSCCSYSVQRSDSFARTGTYSMRMEVRKILPMPAIGYRAEMACQGEPVPNVERWYGFSIYLPMDYASDPADEILAQWHDTPDYDKGETVRSPPISLLTNRKQWHLNIIWATNPVNTNATRSGDASINLGACTPGQWTDWVFHLKFSYQSDGLIQIWKNGAMIATRNGPNYYNDEKGPFFKTGIYKWVWTPDWAGELSVLTKRVIYIDNVKMGNQLAKFSDVDPSK